MRFKTRGDKLDRALELLPRALTHAQQNPEILHHAASIYAQVGDLDRAMHCVRDAHDHKYENMKLLFEDTALVALHAHPEFKKLVMMRRQA